MTQFLSRLTALALVLMVSATMAQAQWRHWVPGLGWPAEVDVLNESNLVPTQIECKDSDRPGLDLSAGFVRVNVVPNTNGISWYWYPTGNLTEANAKMAKKHAHLVSAGSFVRKKSGLKVYCAIYYRD